MINKIGNVLSLFDGMSCGQIALNRAGISYDKYYACEIDKYAIQVTMSNYPDTIQLGSVTDLKASDLPKIDLLIGGSPCQGFSFAGKQLNFNDPRSKLFFEYVRLLKECKPKYFLLENVGMKRKHQDVISKFLDVGPIEINSSLVSAQNRPRIYWCNWGVKQPKDKNILLKDIKDAGIKLIDVLENLNFDKAPYVENYISSRPVNYKTEKFKTIMAGAGSRTRGIGICNDDGWWRKLTPIECERLQTVPNNYTSCVSDSQRYRMLGNGWTVDVIVHIFNSMGTKQYEECCYQLNLFSAKEL